MRHYQYLFCAAIIAAVGGCANVLDKPYQKVRVITPGVEGADCILKNDLREYRVVTPSDLVMDRAPEDLKITCTKAYYFAGEQVVKSKTKFWPAALNVTNGIVPGVAYDVASESIYGYPDVISVDMEWDQAAYDQAHADEPPPVTPLQKKSMPVEPVRVYPPVETQHSDTAFDRSLMK